VNGLARADAPEATDEPETFEATTLNEYNVPFVKPPTVHDISEVEHWNEPGFEVTV